MIQEREQKRHNRKAKKSRKHSKIGPGYHEDQEMVLRPGKKPEKSKNMDWRDLLMEEEDFELDDR